MIEYINPGFILLGGLLLLMVFLVTILVAGDAYKKHKKSYALPIGFTVMALLVAFILYDGYSTKSTIDHNIALFQKAKELECSTLTTSYLVSKQTGWRLRKEAFSKDSLLLDAKYCKE